MGWVPHTRCSGGGPFPHCAVCFDIVRELAPFGINFVVNAHTLSDLDAGVAIAAEVGASEFLLLPQQPVRRRNGIEKHYKPGATQVGGFLPGNHPVGR